MKQAISLLAFSLLLAPIMSATAEGPAELLTDPFLQMPQKDSVNVVWFTEFRGTAHHVEYGEGPARRVPAVTTKLTRVAEDQDSVLRPGRTVPERPVLREVFRHEARLSGLTPGRVPYRVVSVREDTQIAASGTYSLAPLPAPGSPLKILLTSDHQMKPMTAANLQKVSETVGRVDAVFFAGDLVNIPDRASEWFDDGRGGAFFRSLQGRANYELHGRRYTGGELIQHAPLYPAVGNHEVMGRLPDAGRVSLNQEFGDPHPAGRAGEAESKATFNTITYREVFTLPREETYYAVTFGDVRLIVLYATRIWRSGRLSESVRGRYREARDDIEDPERWGNGSFIFEPIHRDSPQYRWLERELRSEEFRSARHRVVMLHHPIHSLGENAAPPFTDPVQGIERDSAGRITAVTYSYPPERDHLLRDVKPLLENAGVELVLNGHSHLWNRFRSPAGTHYLETSNVGNSYGGYLPPHARSGVPGALRNQGYAASGDPGGLEPVMPTLAPLGDQPFVASNEITVFSILRTPEGVVESYFFDTTNPGGPVVLFDSFRIGR